MVVDTRSTEILYAIRGLEKYLNLTEAQMKETRRSERDNMESQRPAGAGEEELGLFLNELDYLDDLYEQTLQPAMRYSFIVLMHIVLETQLRKFCSELQRERQLPNIAVKDFRGSPIEQVRTFLTKLASIRVQDFSEWQEIRMLQKIRDCVVHAYGHVEDSRDSKDLVELAARGVGVSINSDGRIAVTKEFCEQQLANLRNLFHRLFACVGWGD